MKKGLFTLLFIFLMLNITIPRTYCSEDIVYASWVRYDIYLDGKVTNGYEWSECNRYYFTLVDESGTSKTSVSIRIKNDHNYLYGIFAIECRDYDIYDQSYMYYLWETQSGTETIQNSDGILLRQIGGAKDLCNYDNGHWSYDSDCSGTSDVIGAGSYRYPYYYFEFRKELDSQDGIDWIFSPGELIGSRYTPPVLDDLLIIGVLDYSVDVKMQTPISLRLMNDPADRVNVGGGLTEDTKKNNINHILLFLVFILAAGHIINIYSSIRNIPGFGVFPLISTHIIKQLPDKLKSSEDIQKSIHSFFNMISMSLRKKLEKYISGLMLFISNLRKSITSSNIRELFIKFDGEILPSFLLGLVAICLVLALILIITDSRILDDIFYPYLLFVLKYYF